MDTNQQSTTPGAALNRKALILIITTSVLNVAGFGIIIPVAPFLIAQYVSDPNQVGITVGLLTTIYAVCQFAAAPGLGALSDRYGRRPILLICLIGSAVGYLLLGIGGALWVLFLGRIIDGLTGANSSVIMAYVADITPPEQRSKYYGWIGALEGVGIIIGPTIGGLLAKFGLSVPLYVAAAIAFAGVILGLFFLPESLVTTKRAASVSIARLNPLSTLRGVFTLTHLRWLMIAMFLYILPGYILQSNLGLFAKDNLNWDAVSVGALFTVFGVASIIVQAVLLQWLLRRFNAAQLCIGGFGLAALAFLSIAAVALVGSPVLLYVGVILMAMGDGFASPNLSALISQGADASSQGKVQGGSKSMQSLGGMVGPLLAGFLYDTFGHGSPYIVGAGLFLLALGAVVLAIPMLKVVAVKEDVVSA